MSIPVPKRSNAKVCGRSRARIPSSNPAEGMDVCVECVVQSNYQGHEGQEDGVRKEKKIKEQQRAKQKKK